MNINEVVLSRHKRLPVPNSQLLAAVSEKLNTDGDITQKDMMFLTGVAEDGEKLNADALELRESYFIGRGSKAPKWPEEKVD